MIDFVLLGSLLLAADPDQVKFQNRLVPVLEMKQFEEKDGPDLTVLHDFTLNDFISNLRSGVPFAVFSFMDGEPVSIQQEPALAVLLHDGALKNFPVYRLNVMADFESAQKLQAKDPGLLMVYSGGKEISRTAGVVDPQRMTELLSAALPLTRENTPAAAGQN